MKNVENKTELSVHVQTNVKENVRKMDEKIFAFEETKSTLSGGKIEKE